MNQKKITELFTDLLVNKKITFKNSPFAREIYSSPIELKERCLKKIKKFGSEEAIKDLMTILDIHFDYSVIRARVYFVLTLVDSNKLRAMSTGEKDYSLKLLNIAGGRIEAVIEALIQELKANERSDSKSISFIKDFEKEFYSYSMETC